MKSVSVAKDEKAKICILSENVKIVFFLFHYNQTIPVCVASNDFCIFLLDFSCFFILKSTFNYNKSHDSLSSFLLHATDFVT